MKRLIFFCLALIFTFTFDSFAGEPLAQSELVFLGDHKPDQEVYAPYDLRNRKTYIQVTNDESEDPDALPTLCLHIQIFQQDQGCSELNFEDELTPNDTVVYDMDNLVRNDGSPVPVNLNDNSYGYVAISAYECGNRDNDSTGDPLFGNFRIVDDAGYEYRMNLVTDRDDGQILFSGPSPDEARANVIIPFNTVDGANQADIIGFVVENNRDLSGNSDGPNDDLVYNEDVGVTFSVFQIDENEERLSCDQKTIGCGPDVVLNYGINEDYPNSKGGPLLCEGASLLPGQTHGYISLENASFLSPLDAVMSPPEPGFGFICMVGLNNGNGTGSMDTCQYKCNQDEASDCGD